MTKEELKKTLKKIKDTKQYVDEYYKLTGEIGGLGYELWLKQQKRIDKLKQLGI
jgi:hypothetical protein